MRSWITKNKNILIVLLIAFFLRTFYLEQIPFRVDGDASRFAIDGIKAWNEKWPLFSTGWQGQTNLLFYLFGLFVKVFNNNILASRIFSALGGTFSVLGTYLLAKKLFNSKIAIYSSCFMAVSFFNLIFSRVGIDVSWGAFFATTVLYFFLRRGYKAVFLAGIVLGLSQYFGPACRFIIILILFTSFLLIVFRKRKLKEILSEMLILIIGFILIYNPMINYYLRNPETYNTRLNSVGIFHSGWLSMESKNKNKLAIFKNQFENSFFVFIREMKNNPNFWVHRTPYLEKSMMPFFLLGIAVSIMSLKKNYKYFFLLFYFFGGVFLANILTVNPPIASRYTIIFPAVGIFIGLGLEKVINLFSLNIRNKLTILFLFLIGIEAVIIYWRHDSIEIYKHDLNTQIASYTGRFLADKRGNYKIFFLKSGDLSYGSIPTLRLLAQKEGVDISENFNKQEANFAKGDIVIVPMGRETDLTYFKNNYPAGVLTEFQNPLETKLAWIFEVN